LPYLGTCLVCCWPCFRKHGMPSTSFVTWIYLLNILAKWEITCLIYHCTFLSGARHVLLFPWCTCLTVMFSVIFRTFTTAKICIPWNTTLYCEPRTQKYIQFFFYGNYVQIMFQTYNFCFMQCRSTKLNVIARKCIMHVSVSSYIYVMENMFFWNLTALHRHRLRLIEHYVVRANIFFS